jgi:regulatory protein
MHITALEQQAHNPERFNLFVDDRFLLGISAELMLTQRLHVGQELSAEELDQLQYAEARQQAIERSINYLSYRPRSTTEVRRYLRKKETPDEIIESVIEHLQHLDYVNDKAFASFWVENREHFNPKGAQALRSELSTRGVEREIIEELVDGEQDEDLALRAGRKKALQLLQDADLDFTKFRNRLGGFLQRRGFSYQVISRTVRALWQELRVEQAEE